MSLRFFKDAARGRFLPLLLLAAVYVSVSTLTRAALFYVNSDSVDAPFTGFFAVMGVGLLSDLVTCLYLFAAYALYLFALPDRLFQTKWHARFISAAHFAFIFGFLYLGVVEFFFFDEFNARFNFIAVDYLIYPHEVFVNIWDSYPVGRVLIAVFVLALVIHARLKRRLVLAHQRPSRYRERLAPFAAFAGALSVAFGAVDMNTTRYSNNHVANEIAANGVYSFFYAAVNNELDYNRYYLTLDRDEAVRRLRKLVSQPNATFLPNAANPIARHIDNRGPAKKLNVVVVIEESLGADFVGAYGDGRGLTPTIDSLAKDSMMFTNMYATGTRTVRGLEAISLSFPPIPGESIVKRPRNENLFGWGQVMRESGYTPTFIYGGYGTFDNMNYFFGHNGFNIVDRLQIAQPKFGNIWGVSDEDLFQKAIEVFDRQHAQGEKIFSLIMTTSNHKPFTFPEGVPGIQPSGGGRDMGVKYADYALGRFFAAVRAKPYFDDTLFVIVGDHGARVYGREDIPMRSYELPLLVYAPKHIAPRKVDILGSQVDIAPTILGLLGISYDTVFFGRDMFQGDPGEKFALLSHDRDVALYRHGKLVELGIKQASMTLQYDKLSNRQAPIEPDAEAVKDAVAIFENGYGFYQGGLYRLNQEHLARERSSDFGARALAAPLEPGVAAPATLARGL